MSTDKPTPETENAFVRGADGLIWDIAGVGPIVRASDFDKAIRQRDEYARQLAEVTRERDAAAAQNKIYLERLCAASATTVRIQLERDELRAELAALREERAEIKDALQLHQLPYEPDLGISVKANLELAAQDAKRLNWLERRSNDEIRELQWLNNIRTAIDSAMTEHTPAEETKP